MLNSLTPKQNTVLDAITLAGLLIAASFLQSAKAQDAQTVTRDRFSDEIVGAGPDLVFIPGLASSRDTWKAAAARLESHYRVHLIQVAGFAGEPARANASGPVLVPTAEAIDAYLVEQHLTPAIVIGHSLGGTMTLYLAEHHPANLKKAMLVDALPFYATLMTGPSATAESMKPTADAFRANPAIAMNGPRYDQMLNGMATAQADKDTIRIWGKASDPSVVANAVADDLTLDLRPGVAQIATPITLLYPDYAPLGAPAGSTAAMYHAVYAAAPGVKLVPITNSLHFIMLDQPAQFDAALDAFLAQ
jgi:pimeloyl-[acyl-carrier protein] methyl ester esterase